MTGGVLTSPAMLRRCSGSSSSAVQECSSSAWWSSSLRVQNGGWRTRAAARRRQGGLVRLESSWTCSWQDWRSSSKVLAELIPSAVVVSRKCRGPFIVRDDLGGQYETSFEDVDKHLLDYFTFKAVRTVLAQLSEMNPHQYAWFYNYVAKMKPQDSKIFLQHLVKERQELAERVMVTRLHLFNKWVKKYNHAQLHKAISDENLDLLRERLLQTVRFAETDLTDDADTP